MIYKAAPKDPRQERLARALRENLKRRKAQIRGRAEKGAGKGDQAQDKVSGQNG